MSTQKIINKCYKEGNEKGNPIARQKETIRQMQILNHIEFLWYRSDTKILILIYIHF